MPVDCDDTLFLSTWTRNRLLQLGLRTSEEVISAIDDGRVAKMGPKVLAEARRFVGLDPPLPPLVIRDACPRCGGESGYRVRVALSQVRDYRWRGQLEHTELGSVSSETQIVCRDCDQRLPITAPHKR